MHHARSSRHIPAGKQVLSSVYGDDYEGSDLASEIARRDPDLHILMTTPKKPRAGYPMHQHSTPTTTTNRGASAARHMAHTIPESGEASSQYYGYEYEEEMGEEGAELEEEEVEETEEEVSQEGEPMTENEPGYEDIDGDVGQAIEDNGPDIQEEPQSLEQTSRHIPHNKPRQSDQSRAEIPETRRARDSENNSSFSVNGHRRNSCTEERVTRAQRLVAEQEEMDARELLREEEIRIKRQRVREEQARAKMERQFEYEASRERDRMQAETARIKMERLLEEERQAEIERLEEQARIKLERQREYEANREKDRIRAETAKIKMERLLKEERQAERARLEEEARIEMERRIEEEANRERDRIQAETAMIKMERDFEEERQAEYEANRKRDQLHADQARFRMGCVLMEEREIERKRLEKEARLLREKQARAEALSRDEIEMDQIIAANNARELRREETAKNQILAANIAREIYERQEADLEKRQLAELATLEEKHSLHGANYEHSGDDHTEGGSTQDEDAESVFSDYPDEEEEEYPTDPNVIEEIAKFQATFRGIEKKFRLINKIGEGTFSSVYKAEDLLYDKYDNSWDLDEASRRGGTRPPKYVAIKKIYVTSSPARIQNELELLHDLQGCKTVVPLITAFRHQDQVVAILPYFQHVDFREYFRTLKINDIVNYFKSLFSALAHVHAQDIIHRDIKPTNFLYDCYKGRGVLCDFGLAEREGTESSFCVCSQPAAERKEYRLASNMTTPSQGYPKNDSRPSRRANRAGTRGFRAPEVLFKCTNQTTKIDIWSSGVILLTILSKRFPFFNSSDDVDAIIEIATIFGKAKMRACSALHGCIFETTIPTVGEKGFTLEKIVLWATNRTSGGSGSSSTNEDRLPPGEALACQFLARCFELDPTKRISAEEALQHEFLNYHEEEEEEEEYYDDSVEGEDEEGYDDEHQEDEEMEM